MRKPEAGVFLAMTLALAACAIGPSEGAPPPAGPADVVMTPATDPAAKPGQSSLGFLTAATTPDAVNIIPPAPSEGDARNTADWAIFKATRSLEGSARWKLAQNDDSYKPADLLKDFSCSMNATLTPENSPTLASILARVGTDAGAAALNAKNKYKRQRPFLFNDGQICIERSEGLKASFDYPSGHSSASWVEGLVLAELAPDRATQILQRARAYGESRVVCGVHNWSAVEAGRTNGASVFAALQGSADFRAAMAKAKAEVEAARASATKPDAAACAAEFELTKPLQP